MQISLKPHAVSAIDCTTIPEQTARISRETAQRCNIHFVTHEMPCKGSAVPFHALDKAFYRWGIVVKQQWLKSCRFDRDSVPSYRD